MIFCGSRIDKAADTSGPMNKEFKDIRQKLYDQKFDLIGRYHYLDDHLDAQDKLISNLARLLVRIDEWCKS